MNDLKKMVELTVSLHKLILHGIDESDAGEAIRDESDNYWYKLSEENKDWLRNFSASLYDMTDIVFDSTPMRKCSEEIDRLRKEIERLKNE